MKNDGMKADGYKLSWGRSIVHLTLDGKRTACGTSLENKKIHQWVSTKHHCYKCFYNRFQYWQLGWAKYVAWTKSFKWWHEVNTYNAYFDTLTQVFDA
jgi:hypothetical protein